MKNASLISISAHVSRILATAAVLAAFAVFPTMAADAPKPVAKATAAHDSNGKIAVVDLQFILMSSKAGKSINSQLESKRNEYRKQIEKREAAMNKEAKDLSAQQGKISKEEFMKKYGALNDKAKAGQHEVFERTKAFEQAYLESTKKLHEHIFKIVQDLAIKNDIALVLNRQGVVLVDARMDLTKEVMAALDKKVSSIPVNIK